MPKKTRTLFRLPIYRSFEENLMIATRLRDTAFKHVPQAIPLGTELKTIMARSVAEGFADEQTHHRRTAASTKEYVCQAGKQQSSREHSRVLVRVFLRQDYNVVGTSLHATASLTASPTLALVDGDIGKQETAAKAVEAAITHFGIIDVLVNNAGIFYVKPFTEFTTDDFNALASTNLLGFLYITQLTVKQMLKQKSGNVVTITGALADNPIAGINASVSMITKGDLNTVTRSLAIEYAKEGIRFNAVAPGTVDTPLHKNAPKEQLRSLQPMRSMS